MLLNKDEMAALRKKNETEEAMSPGSKAMDYAGMGRPAAQPMPMRIGCASLLLGAQILLDCAPGSRSVPCLCSKQVPNKRLCSREHKSARRQCCAACAGAVASKQALVSCAGPKHRRRVAFTAQHS